MNGEASTTQSLPELLDGQMQAAAMLLPAIAPGATPTHAFLFHGPAGVGKENVAYAFAGELLAAGALDPESVKRRVRSNTHSDLTWIVPSGANEMRITDIDQAVVKAATMTPFESQRRVFVLEQAETMSQNVANRLLKSLEEPPSFVFFILLSTAIGRVLPTVVSRCQPVPFQALAPGRIAADLMDIGTDPEEAAAVGALSGGDRTFAEFLVTTDGKKTRDEAGRILACALRGVSAVERPWDALITRAEAAGTAALEAAEATGQERAENVSKGRERQAILKEIEAAGKRDARRARTKSLSQSLRIIALLLRDLSAQAAGAPESIITSDREAVIARHGTGRQPGPLIAAVESVIQAEADLRRNVSEQLALEALSYRLESLLVKL